ncbi:hypothetical protein [Brevibacillus brevis]|uniref:hypothetical protein n=1 Tax=Brevibacillus brevis TaxID=1393 RepID=UPI0011590775|nr:hypothetical protein [Lysinibacillus sp. SDF0063]TQR29404.1 hypothetical protein C7Y45_28820 [Lysinibacillus sp. SDF0063]
MTGISLQLFTKWSELQAVKDGTSTIMIARIEKHRFLGDDFQINVPLDVCEVVGKEVRVNISQIKQATSELGEMMGKTFGAELDRVLKEIE